MIGEGSNFVATMAGLAERGFDPAVVDDQIGRLTFTEDLAAAIDHLLTARPDPGTYNVTCEGEPVSWARIAAEVYTLTGHDPARVRPVTTAEYYTGKTGIAPAPGAVDAGPFEDPRGGLRSQGPVRGAGRAPQALTTSPLPVSSGSSGAQVPKS